MSVRDTYKKHTKRKKYVEKVILIKQFIGR